MARAAGPAVAAALLGGCWLSKAFVPPSARALRGADGVALPASLGEAPAARVLPQAASAADAPSGFFGRASAAAGAALCGLACLAAAERRRRSARAGRAGLVVRNMYPSTAKPNRQDVLRRLSFYGAIPAWTRQPLKKKRVVRSWRKRQTSKLSAFGRALMERQRVRFHYNISYAALKCIVTPALKKGVTYPMDQIFQTLESRIDNLVWRVGLAPTMAAARKFVTRGYIQYLDRSQRWFTCNKPGCRLRPGTLLRVTRGENGEPEELALKQVKQNQEGEEPVELPRHLVWDNDKLEGEYITLCSNDEIGLNVDETIFLRNFLDWGARGVHRDHYRYFAGTTKLIDKKYRGGRIRPTPENILNMKRGIGLNKRGRAKPPCLWGRKYPLNDPYLISRRIRF